MHWSDIRWHPSTRMLRQFAGLWIVFFAGLAAWHGLVHERMIAAVVCATLAATLGPLGLIWPACIRPVFVAWIVVAFPIGWVVSRVTLAILFYGLFTPLA